MYLFFLKGGELEIVLDMDEVYSRLKVKPNVKCSGISNAK